MEIEYIQKEIRPIAQNHVIKLLTFYLLFFVTISCKSNDLRIHSTKNDYELINKQLKILIPKEAQYNILLDKNFNQIILSYLDDLEYEDSDSKNHILILNFGMSKNLVKRLFNHNQINSYKQNYIQGTKIDSVKIIQNNFQLIDINESTENEDLFTKALISLSRPIYNEDGNHAIIGFYSGNYLRELGESGFTIYEFTEGQWVAIQTIIMELS